MKSSKISNCRDFFCVFSIKKYTSKVMLNFWGVLHFFNVFSILFSIAICNCAHYQKCRNEDKECGQKNFIQKFNHFFLLFEIKLQFSA